MKLHTIITSALLLTTLVGCNIKPTDPTPALVEWETAGNKTKAVVEKRKGLEIAYVSEQGQVKRLSVGNEPFGDNKYFVLTQGAFIMQLPKVQPWLFSGPNIAPCNAGDDCVPPVPPKLQGIWLEFLRSR